MAEAEATVVSGTAVVSKVTAVSWKMVMSKA
jgi:hypothetical protein